MRGHATRQPGCYHKVKAKDTEIPSADPFPIFIVPRHSLVRSCRPGTGPATVTDVNTYIGNHERSSFPFQFLSHRYPEKRHQHICTFYITRSMCCLKVNHLLSE
ncbi:hypothetical protein BDV36DRAFT_59567 [Aspergillus pseudocaelatus]|uniref:Uncharacterized protein n=1 Tax=Aspergillus pseudocaelatus TaxID=1825620 RepID=A0ABQ6WWF5_9EURO|nr:hypothetical protein BDV36DRAFT_59567 [Aspergillus pseudocaelatus]